MKIDSLFSVVLIAVLLQCSAREIAGAVDEVDRSRDELHRRNAELVREGFGLTNRLVLGEGKVAKIQFFVPPTQSEHTIYFGVNALGGEVSFQLRRGDGQILAVWTSHAGEKFLSLSLPTGRIEMEVDGSQIQSAFALFGVKGPTLSPCQLDPKRILRNATNIASGFYWPYLLYIPNDVRAKHLLSAPNNTGFPSTDPELLDADGVCTIAKYVSLSDRMGIPVMVPLFPRPVIAGKSESLYLHALSRASLLCQTPQYARIDLQFIAMLDDARSELARRGVEISPRIMLTGFSASGSFVSRFAMLHPDRVVAVASGSPGGWPIAPKSEEHGAVLPFPLGIADVQDLIGSAPDITALGQVKWFFFMGDQDTNDSVPYRDSFSKSDETLIFRIFGPTPVARWEQAGHLYRGQGLNAQFKLYPGVAHKFNREMRDDVESFFEKVIGSSSDSKE